MKSKRRINTRELITEIFTAHPDWNASKVYDHYVLLLGGTSEAVGISSIQKYLEELRPREKEIRNSRTEHPWNTAALNTESINPETVPWLIAAQVNRKAYSSKPLTIREAKWFNRLHGFSKKVIVPKELESDHDLFESFRINYIATWAQIYAHREKTDSIVGEESPDYSDLDMVILGGDFYELPLLRNKLWDKIGLLAFGNEKSRQKLESFSKLVTTDRIWLLEADFIGYSLGTPDLIDDSMSLYSEVLLTPTKKSESDPELIELLESLSIKQRTQYLIDVRKKIKDGPNIADIQAEIKKIALGIKDGEK